MVPNIGPTVFLKIDQAPMASGDYYAVLGVETPTVPRRLRGRLSPFGPAEVARDASDAEIKKAYRKDKPGIFDVNGG